MNDTREGDLQAPAATDHDHGDPEGARISSDLMSRMGISCGHLGAHGHDSHPLHHHHDLRCLVEAGANAIRPDLKTAKERLEIKARSQQHYMRKSEEFRLDALSAQASLRAVRASATEMVAFMESMPAVGPWTTVFDQYNSWLDEQATKEAP